MSFTKFLKLAPFAFPVMKMKDIKDQAERLKYLNEERKKQEERRKFYVQEIENLKKLILENEKEIKYNESWVAFHEKSIENHKKRLREITGIDEKHDQEAKLKFHVGQIENHHKSYISYHKKEVEFLKREIQMFEDGLRKCKEQIIFLDEKLRLL